MDNNELHTFLNTLHSFDMIDKRTPKNDKKVDFVCQLCEKVFNKPVDNEKLLTMMNDILFETFEFESENDDFIHYDRELEAKKGDETYERFRHKRFYECEVNDDVFKLADDVAELVEHTDKVGSLQSEPFKRLEAQKFDENTLILKLYLHNEDYNCEEYEIRLKFWRVKPNHFNYIVLKTKRTN